MMAQHIGAKKRVAVAIRTFKRISTLSKECRLDPGEQPQQCFPCAVLGKSAESRAHAMAKCPFLKNRCFRCWDDSHRGVQCTLHPKFRELMHRQQLCETCCMPPRSIDGVRIHEGQGSVGLRCEYKDQVLPAALMLYDVAPLLVKAMVGPVACASSASMMPRTDYLMWLSQCTDGCSNAMRVVAHAIEQSKKKSDANQIKDINAKALALVEKSGEGGCCFLCLWSTDKRCRHGLGHCPTWSHHLARRLQPCSSGQGGFVRSCFKCGAFGPDAHHGSACPNFSTLEKALRDARMCTSCCLPLFCHRGLIGARCPHGDGIRQACILLYRTCREDLPGDLQQSLSRCLSESEKWKRFSVWLSSWRLGTSNAANLVVSEWPNSLRSIRQV